MRKVDSLKTPDTGSSKWIKKPNESGLSVSLYRFTQLHHIKIHLMTGPLKSINRIILRSEEHTSELQSRGHLVCRLLLEKKKKTKNKQHTLFAFTSAEHQVEL